jgi:hypothetical protein
MFGRDEVEPLNAACAGKHGPGLAPDPDAPPPARIVSREELRERLHAAYQSMLSDDDEPRRRPQVKRRVARGGQRAWPEPRWCSWLR